MSDSVKNQLEKLDITVKPGPLYDGKYKLPDNTILKVRDGQYEHTGHRDKKEQRQLLRQTEQELRLLLQIPGYGGYKAEDLEKMNKIELANLLNPKPKCYFLYTYIENPTDVKAKRLASLVKKAVPFEPRPNFKNDKRKS
jgi:hypothetical protein